MRKWSSAYRLITLACPRPLSLAPYKSHAKCLRSMSTSGNDDESAKKSNYNNWMDEALSRWEVMNNSGDVRLDDTHWEEFERTCSITEPPDIEERLNVAKKSGERVHEVSEEFMREMLELESEDLSDIIDIHDMDIETDSEDVEKQFANFLTSNSDALNAQTKKVGHPEGISEEQSRTDVRSGNKEDLRGFEALVDVAAASGHQSGDRKRYEARELSALPKHRKKPGYEKRVMRLESEMTKVIEEALSSRFPEWDQVRACILQVSLSPNMGDLTIVYEVDKYIHQSKEWKSVMNRIRKGVRTEIAKLDLKYAPKVHFQCATANDKCNQKSELDDIFARIEQDRESGEVSRLKK